MNKLIIDNRTGLSDLEALGLVSRVVELGRISNEGAQYSYVCSVMVNNKEYTVVSSPNKKSDRFVIYD